MTDFAINHRMDQGGPIQPASRPNLDKRFNPLTMIMFFGILAAGLLFVAYSIYVEIDATGAKANGSGLQMATIRNLLMAWVLTLPAAILLSGTLHVIFSRLF